VRQRLRLVLISRVVVVVAEAVQQLDDSGTAVDWLVLFLCYVTEDERVSSTGCVTRSTSPEHAPRDGVR
jgi:hypothetical protein